MNNTVTVSTTELKNNLSDIINSVYYEKKTTIVERHGKPLLKLMPITEKRVEKRDINALVDKYFGILPDFPDVTKMRHMRKRAITL